MASNKKTEELDPRLELLLTSLKKDFGADSVISFADGTLPGIEFISSSCISLDRTLGGGYARGRIVEVYGVESGGKAQPLSSQVLTPTGWKPIRDIVPGTIVCTPDGDNSTVINIYPQGIQQTYRITLDDKSTTICTADHLWLVYTRNTELGEVLSTKELLIKGLSSKNGCRKFRIPSTAPLQFAGDKLLPIDPYLLGLLLGDGCFRGPTIGFSTKDEELLSSISTVFTRDFPDMTISEKMGECDYHLRKRIRGHRKTELFSALESLGLIGKLSEEKFIPEEYLLSGMSQRVALLQGLIDTDGSVDDKGGISFTTSSPTLSKQFEFLTRSLGFRCTTSSRVTKYTSATGEKIDGLPSFRSSLLDTSSIKAARLLRKAMYLRDKPSTHRFRFIESIEPLGYEECQCIKIGHPDELYITDDFVVTHNTTLCLHAIAEAQKKGLVCAFIDAEHSLDLNYAQALGVQVGKLLFSQPDSGETALQIVDQMVRSGAVGLVVVDSVAALVPQKELEGEIGDQLPGSQARLMSQAMRKLVGACHTSQCTIIFTNQIRFAIGVMFGSPERRPGGEALKFFASQRVEIRRIGTEKEDEVAVANKVRVKVVKNKIAPPFKECELTLVFGKGLDYTTDTLNLAVDAGLVEKNGAHYSLNGEKIAHGEDKAVEWLEAHPEALQSLKDQLLEHNEH